MHTYFGTTVTDDYAWLEDGGSREVRAFTDAETVFARATLDALPERAAVPSSRRFALGRDAFRLGRRGVCRWAPLCAEARSSEGAARARGPRCASRRVSQSRTSGWSSTRMCSIRRAADGHRLLRSIAQRSNRRGVALEGGRRERIAAPLRRRAGQEKVESLGHISSGTSGNPSCVERR